MRLTLTDEQVDSIMRNFIKHVIAEDRIFRRHARLHADHAVHLGKTMGEGVYDLCNQNLWDEIYGPRVWNVSTTYWTG
jgi:hypothetical protein